MDLDKEVPDFKGLRKDLSFVVSCHATQTCGFPPPSHRLVFKERLGNPERAIIEITLRFKVKPLPDGVA